MITVTNGVKDFIENQTGGMVKSGGYVIITRTTNGE